MRDKFPHWIVKRTLDFDSVCRGKYVEEYLAVSHRCARIRKASATERYTRLRLFVAVTALAWQVGETR